LPGLAVARILIGMTTTVWKEIPTLARGAANAWRSGDESRAGASVSEDVRSLWKARRENDLAWLLVSYLSFFRRVSAYGYKTLDEAAADDAKFVQDLWASSLKKHLHARAIDWVGTLASHPPAARGGAKLDALIERLSAVLSAGVDGIKARRREVQRALRSKAELPDLKRLSESLTALEELQHNEKRAGRGE
jgi:hypothetical protein